MMIMNAAVQTAAAAAVLFREIVADQKAGNARFFLCIYSLELTDFSCLNLRISAKNKKKRLILFFLRILLTIPG